MTIKKYSRNQRFDDYEDRPSKLKHKDRSEKRLRNALRTNDLDELTKLSDDDDMDEYYDYDNEYRQ
jgi:hypothetical protein